MNSFIRSKIRAQLLSAHKNVHILPLYLFQFPKLYPLSNVPLPERRTGTAWEHTKPESFLPLPLKCRLSLLPPHIFFPLFLTSSVFKALAPLATVE
jgi:hypothetical protein